MPDFRFKYGRKPKKTDPRTLQFAKYLTPAPPVAPASVSWQHGLSSFGMMLNDTLGDCTIAAVGHAVQVWLANNNQVASVPDSTILEYYEKWDGYVLNDPSTDQGGVCLDVLSDWQKQGFANYPLKAFAEVNPRDRQQVKQAIYLFGGVYIGLNVPQFVENNEDPSVVWDNQTTQRDIVGGHCVFVIGYNANFIHFISWGQVYMMTVAFWKNFVTESYALLSPSWLATSGAPNGFDLAQLEADLAQIK